MRRLSPPTFGRPGCNAATSQRVSEPIESNSFVLARSFSPGGNKLGQLPVARSWPSAASRPP